MDQRKPSPTLPLDILAIICAWYTVPPQTFVAWLALYLAWRLAQQGTPRS